MGQDEASTVKVVSEQRAQEKREREKRKRAVVDLKEGVCQPAHRVFTTADLDGQSVGVRESIHLGPYNITNLEGLTHLDHTLAVLDCRELFRFLGPKNMKQKSGLYICMAHGLVDSAMDELARFLVEELK